MPRFRMKMAIQLDLVVEGASAEEVDATLNQGLNAILESMGLDKHNSTEPGVVVTQGLIEPLDTDDSDVQTGNGSKWSN